MHACSLNIATERLGNTAWDNHSVIHIRKQIASYINYNGNTQCLQSFSL